MNEITYAQWHEEVEDLLKKTYSSYNMRRTSKACPITTQVEEIQALLALLHWIDEQPANHGCGLARKEGGTK